VLLLNNSVISAFCELKRFDTLRQILAALRTDAAVPAAVDRELIFPEAARAIERGKAARGGKWLRLLEHEDMRRQASQCRLSEGETAVILLAERLHGIAVLDDLRARKVARARGVTVSGTLALLRAGFEHCPIRTKRELRRFIKELQAIHFHVPSDAKAYLLAGTKIATA
jgi:predicted nucleic acid-binding protein